MFDWSDIKTFLAVMEHGSAAAAARGLGTNQTTVTRRIARLEAALGLRLFERGARGTHPTANARALLPEAQEMAGAAAKLQNHAAGMQRHLTGSIRLTTTPGFPRHISALLAAFRALHPQVRFDLDADDRPLSLEDGEADIAIRAAKQLHGDTLKARKLLDHPWGVYASKSYLQDRGIPRSVDALRGHSAVVFGAAIEERLDCVARFQRHLPKQAGFLTVSSVEAMEGLLVSGEGVGILPRASGDAEAGLRLCFTEPEMVQRFWLVWSPQAEATPHIRAFITFVTERLPHVLAGLPPEWVA